MLDPLQVTPPTIASEPAVDRTMLDRTILGPAQMCRARAWGETVLLDLVPGGIHPEPVGQRYMGALYRPQHHQRHSCGHVRPL